MGSNKAILHLENIRKSFGGLLVLSDIDLSEDQIRRLFEPEILKYRVIASQKASKLGGLEARKPTEFKIFIAHLLSREELLKHHGNYSPVAGDTVPQAADMRRMCQAAGLTEPQITDNPGLYLARALKA